MGPSDIPRQSSPAEVEEERLSSRQSQLWRRRLLFGMPVLVFGGIAIALGSGLSDNPRTLPSALLNKLVPRFSLPPVKGRSLGLSSDNFTGAPSLLNVFASWCVACRDEHPLWMELKANSAVALHGLNYKDMPDNAAKWLDTLGDPYTRTGADQDGRVAIDWGVYGVPETFVVSPDGVIVHKHIGPITRRDLAGTIMPLVAKLQT